MREIKFRAWDKEENRMLKENEIVAKIGAFQVEQPISLRSINEMLNSERFIFLQYTGLKDKEGNEIYEGDIVKFMAENWLVYYDTNYNCLFLKDKEGHKTNPSKDMLNRAKLIDNKYYNPELLEEEK